MLSFVVAGQKDNAKFEFYEYGDYNVAESVYNEIWNGLSEKSSLGKSSEYEKELINGGKIITFKNEGTKLYLLCKDGNIIYAYAPIDNSEIDILLNKLGLTVK